MPAPVAPRPAAPGAQPAAIDPPAIAAHADVLAEATGRGGATVDYGLPTAHNTAGHDVPVACSPAPAGIFPIGSTRVTCSARDSGGFASLSFTVLVRDTTPPALQLPPSLSADATSPDGAVVTFSATATDLVDGAVSASCTPASGSLFPVGSTQAVCSARDAAGNTASSSFIVSVNGGDFSAPTISGHAGELAEATGPGGATVGYALPSANDDADGSVPVSCAPAPGSLFPLGSTQVTCNAQDSAGNVATLSFAVTVRDTTPPALQLPPGVSAPATSASGAVVSFSATATDLVDGTVSATCLPASGSLFPVGSTQVTCSAQDVAGNLTNSSFTIAVGNAPDTTPPTIAAHADTVAEATGPSGATVSYTPPTGSDAFDGSVSVTCLPASGSVFSLGSTTVNCSAHDAAGNAASSSFSVIVRDTTPPTIAAHADLTAEAGGAGGATVTYTAPTANDNLDGPVTVSCLPASGSLFAFGSTTVTCSAHDAAGNDASSSFAVLVRDTTTPTIAAARDAEAIARSSPTRRRRGPTTSTGRGSCLPASGSSLRSARRGHLAGCREAAPPRSPSRP